MQEETSLLKGASSLLAADRFCGFHSSVVENNAKRVPLSCWCSGTLGSSQWPVWRADWPGENCQEDHAPCSDIAQMWALLCSAAGGHWVTGMFLFSAVCIIVCMFSSAEKNQISYLHLTRILLSSSSYYTTFSKRNVVLLTPATAYLQVINTLDKRDTICLQKHIF